MLLTTLWIGLAGALLMFAGDMLLYYTPEDFACGPKSSAGERINAIIDVMKRACAGVESRYYDGIDRCELYEIHRPRGDTGRMEDGVRLAVGKRLLQAQAKKVDPTAEAEGIIMDYSTSAVEHI